MRSRELPYAWAMAAVLASVAGAILVSSPWLALLAPAAIIMIQLLPRPEWMIYALFFSIPFSAEVQLTASLGTDLPDEALMWLCSVMMVFVMYRERARLAAIVSHPIVACTLLSWLWSWVSMAFADNAWLSLKFILAKTWYLLPFLFGTILVLDDLVKLRKASLLVVVPMVLLVLVTLVRHAWSGFHFTEVSDVVWPYFRNHVNYGALLVCTIPLVYLLWKRSRHVGWVFALAVMLIGVYFSYSRGAWLALAGGVLASWSLRKRILLLSLTAVLFTLTLFSTWLVKDNNYLHFRPDFERTIYHADLGDHIEATYRMQDLSTAERFYRWIAAERIWEDHPLAGVGPNHFVPVYRSYTVEAFRTYVSDNPERSTVHNYFLLLLAEQGLPGLLLFVFTLGAIFITAQRLYNRSEDSNTRSMLQGVVAVVSMIVVLISLSDLVETDKIGSVFYVCAGILVAVSSGSYVQRVPQAVTEQVEG